MSQSHTEARRGDTDQPARARPRENPLLRASSLSKLVDEETDEPATRKTSLGVVDALTAAWLKSIYTAYMVHEGKRLALRGAVTEERGLLPDECARLGARPGVAARFRVAVERRGSPMSITIATIDATVTARAQEAARLRRVASWIIEVRAFDAPAFWTWESATPRPWALVALVVE